MSNRGSLAVLAGIILALSLASHVSAQAPIEGWDKAKFGMSPEEVRSTYAEEEIVYLEEKYYSRKDYWKGREEPEEHVGKEKEAELEEIRAEMPFWETDTENEFSYTPHTLRTSELTVLGQDARVSFSFVNNQLFRIEIYINDYEIKFSFFLKGELTEEEVKSEKAKLLAKAKEKYVSLMSFLEDKYGDPSAVGTKENWEWYRWTDEENDTAMGCSFSVEPGWRSMYIQLLVGYYDGKLEKAWLSKVEEWKEQKKRIEQRIKKIKERIGTEAF